MAKIDKKEKKPPFKNNKKKNVPPELPGELQRRMCWHLQQTPIRCREMGDL